MKELQLTDITANQKIIDLLDEYLVTFEIVLIDNDSNNLEIEITPIWDDWEGVMDSYTLSYKKGGISDEVLINFIERFTKDFESGETFDSRFVSDYSYDRLELKNIEQDLIKMDCMFDRLAEKLKEQKSFLLNKATDTSEVKYLKDLKYLNQKISISDLDDETIKKLEDKIYSSKNTRIKGYLGWCCGTQDFSTKEALDGLAILDFIDKTNKPLQLSAEIKNFSLKTMENYELLEFARNCQTYGIESLEVEKILAKPFVKETIDLIQQLDISDINLIANAKSETKPKINKKR